VRARAPAGSAGVIVAVVSRTPHLASPGRDGTLTPLSAIGCGLAAGGLGTAAMDALLFVRYRRGGGWSRFSAWESSAGIADWEQAPAPAQVGRRLVDGLFQTQLPARRARLVNNVTHWAYGILGGAQYGVVAGSLPRRHVLYGLPFGAAVWGAGYIVLPAMKLYEPIWAYDRKTLANDLSAHLVYGLATAASLQALSR
jgi:hypothetical protein